MDNLNDTQKLEEKLKNITISNLGNIDLSPATNKLLEVYGMHEQQKDITNEELMLVESELEQSIVKVLRENSIFLEDIKRLVANKELIIKTFLLKKEDEVAIKEKQKVEAVVEYKAKSRKYRTYKGDKRKKRMKKKIHY